MRPQKQIEIPREALDSGGWVSIRPMTPSQRRKLRQRIYELMEELARLPAMLDKLPD